MLGLSRRIKLLGVSGGSGGSYDLPRNDRLYFCSRPTLEASSGI